MALISLMVGSANDVVDLVLIGGLLNYVVYSLLDDKLTEVLVRVL